MGVTCSYSSHRFLCALVDKYLLLSIFKKIFQVQLTERMNVYGLIYLMQYC